jgi:hypothetical protein
VPVESHVYVLEPAEDAVVWRFLDMTKFRDLMANEELYFRRADRFAKDPNEGIPPDDWLRATLKLQKYVLADEVKLSAEKGNLSQFREASYISCWHLFNEEDAEVWREFAPYGVAIRTRYGLLKDALNSLIDQILLGLTRYGYKLTDPHNLIQFIFTKGTDFIKEREVRVVMSCYDPVGSTNRNFGPTNNFPHDRPLKSNPLHKWVADGKRRRIKVKPLVTGVVVSPLGEQ